jgi:hypothetical protein
MLASVAGGIESPPAMTTTPEDVEPAPAAEPPAEPVEVSPEAPVEPPTGATAGAPPGMAAKPPPELGEWTGPQPTAAGPAEPTLAGPAEPTLAGPAEPMEAGPAMPPTSVTVMGASSAPQRRFGEPLFPTTTEPSGEPADEGPAASEGIIRTPTALAGWLVVAGAVVAGLSFLLPWADRVIGSGSPDESYIGHWGLANAPNILLMLASFGIAWLAIAPLERWAWLRTGALPVIFGGLLIGVAWPYALGPFGPRLGLWVAVIGGVLLLVSGLWGLHEILRDHGDEPAAPA